MGEERTGAAHARVRKLVDLGNLRRQALGRIDPLLEIGVVGQLRLRFLIQLVQLEERVIRRAQPKIIAHLVGAVSANTVSSSCALLRLNLPVIEEVIDTRERLLEAGHVVGIQ